MDIVGYSDRWTVQVGGTVRFYVSTAQSHYRAELVRLIHGDQNPRGPGHKEVRVASEADGTYPGRQQPIRSGSYVRVDRFADLATTGDFSLLLWLKATATERGEQGVIAQWDPASGAGFGMFIDPGSGRLEARIHVQGGSTTRIASTRPLHREDWHFCALTYSSATRELVFATATQRPGPFDQPFEYQRLVLPNPPVFAPKAPLLIGAGWLESNGGYTGAQACFNGKISAPLACSVALEEAGLRELAAGSRPRVERALLASWDFSHDPGGQCIPDRSGHGFDGITVNRPTRAVTGHNWTATQNCFSSVPAEYNAIHFHDDDLDDARWHESFRFAVPKDLRSGIYAFKLSTAAGEVKDFLPFFVRPPTGAPTAKVALLIPTVSYLAYSNESLDFGALADSLQAMAPLRDMTLAKAEYSYLDGHWLRSTYDHHRDMTGICHTTVLRPSLTSMRPGHRARPFNGPHQLSADLHLVDWLESQGIAYDVITDHDLHREGAAVLTPYRAILTGTHAEYWTAPMQDGLEAYEQAGGRVIYLSGNGLYWVTALDRDTQTVLEVRRCNGSRAWIAAPGEGFISLTGEEGGVWALRGRAAQRYVGVGTASQGFDRGVPYRRTPASRDPRAAFIFEGIDSELIGDQPALVLNWGAAGYEIDRADPTLGTPRHALVVATSLRFSDSYQYVIEELPVMLPMQGGLNNPLVRSDMVFYELPNGGAVFSVGSIAFCSTLFHNNYQNSTSQLLGNVIRAFSSDGTPPWIST